MKAMNPLDQLRKLDAEASPHPWFAYRLEKRERYDIHDASGDQVAEFSFESDARLASLAHHLLPLAEALGNQPCYCSTGYPGTSLLPGRKKYMCGPCRALANLAKDIKGQ